MGICDTKPEDEKKIGDRTVKFGIIMKVSKSVCRLYNKANNEYATGFFMDIYPSFKCLLTNYKVITQNMVDSNSVIKISNNSGVNEELKLNKNERYIKCLEIYDITIIQIKESDKINKYFDSLKPDFNFKNIPTEITEDILNVFCLHYPKSQKIEESSGKIIKISWYNFIHTVATEYGSLGCPIILSNTSNVIGINKLGKNINENYGTFIGIIFDEVYKDIKNGLVRVNSSTPELYFILGSNSSVQNIITSKINIDNENINKDVLIINSYEEFSRRADLKNCPKELYNEKEIKECEIKIDDKLINFSYTYKFDTVGEHTIIYKFKKNLTNLSCLFCDCSLITSIDLSNFNAENVKYMRLMFFGCKSLTNIDLFNFNTSNTIDMMSMFAFCSSLINLDLSDFNTENVESMELMFSFCSSIRNLNLSNFNTKNVISMAAMFSQCSNLRTLNLSSFNTENVEDMKAMFSFCNSLINLDLSNFNTRNVTNMSEMFALCSSLRDLDLSNFEIKNVKNMDKMFYGCISLRKDKLNKLKNYVIIYSENKNNKKESPSKNIGQKDSETNNNEDRNLFFGDMNDKFQLNEPEFFIQSFIKQQMNDPEHIQRYHLEFNFIPNIISELYSKGEINDNIIMNPPSWINYEIEPGKMNPRFLEKIAIQKKKLKNGKTKFIIIFPPPIYGLECFFAILYFDKYRNSSYYTLELEFGNDMGSPKNTGLVCGQKGLKHLNYATICKANLEDFENVVSKLYDEN